VTAFPTSGIVIQSGNFKAAVEFAGTVTPIPSA